MTAKWIDSTERRIKGKFREINPFLYILICMDLDIHAHTSNYLRIQVRTRISLT